METKLKSHENACVCFLSLYFFVVEKRIMYTRLSSNMVMIFHNPVQIHRALIHRVLFKVGSMLRFLLRQGLRLKYT